MPLAPITTEIKDRTIFKDTSLLDPALRPIVAGSIGCHVPGILLPHPDPNCKESMKAGVKKRFACKPPPHNPALLRDLEQFVARWCVENLVPLSVDTDLSQETWLQEAPYPEWRRNELLTRWNNIGGKLQDKHYYVKSFMKDEHYADWKYPRAINARTDEFKCAVGPWFHAIEKEIFKNEYFIKYIPVSERPAYIKSMLYSDGARFMCTDYTSFEAHFTQELMTSVEFVMYKYMTQRLPGNVDFSWILDNVLAGRNHCIFKGFNVDVDATRMSGEMCTSLGNGFANLMFLLFVCSQNGNTNVRAVIEGDDCLATMIGDFPTTENFRDLGLTIKIEEHDSLNHASFCGLVFDLEDELVVCDPMSKVASFGWVQRKYARSKTARQLELLRAKSLSLLYQFPGCPIVTELAKYGLRVSEGYRANFAASTDYWSNRIAREAIAYHNSRSHADIEIPMATRLLVEEKFGVSVEQQLVAEDYLRNLDKLQPLEIELNFPGSWHEYAQRYVHVLPVSPYLEYPPVTF